MGLGSVIFGFIGACTRWLYGTIWRSIAGKQRYTFREYLNGPDNSEDWFDDTGQGFVNNLVGFCMLMLICWIIVKLGI